MTETLEGEISTGTGFFYKFNIPDQYELPVIVTNKHVIQDSARMMFRFHFGRHKKGKLKPSGEYGEFFFDQTLAHVVDHPDSSVDLCAIAIDPAMLSGLDEEKSIYFEALDASILPNNETLSRLDAAEEIYMIGYPNSLWDEVNNFPIFRKGITATHPAIDFNGKTEFVVDIACFPGSSGSPILMIEKGTESFKMPNMYLGLTQIIFLGILYSGPVFLDTADITIQETPVTRIPIARLKTMIHLGYAIKSTELLRLEQETISRLKNC